MYINESDNIYHIYQDFYMNKIEQIPSKAKFSKFASMIMKLAWLSNTIHDIVLEILEIAQVTRTMYEKNISKKFQTLKQSTQICTIQQGIHSHS